MNFLEELSWRNMLHDVTPGAKEYLERKNAVGYIGFDPTSDSLHIGSLVQIMILIHFQKAGHKPIALLGGATGMVGDPSGKSKERNLLAKEKIDYNVKEIKKQLKKFLSFDCGKNSAEIINNYNWFKNFNLLSFIRDIGKHITISYMLTKDSVQSRMENGLSFTEFTYQLIQGYDFYHLYKHHNCAIQLGGSDQWGNIVTGTELIRRLEGGSAFAATTPLITKSDGGKFGKTEDGNIWLDPKKTSPYKFYQFWLNTSDEDAKKYIKIFTLLSKKEINELEAQHNNAPHLRILQTTLAKDITTRVHSKEDTKIAINASRVLFGKSTKEDIKKLDKATILSVFEGVPRYSISKKSIAENVNILVLLTELTNIFQSKSEARRMLKDNAVSINKLKVSEGAFISLDDTISNSFIIVQKGKKSYHLINIT